MTTQLHQVRIDLDAVSANLAVLGRDYRVDLSADAYGHGFSRVAHSALDAGTRDFIVRDTREEGVLREIAAGRTIQVTIGDWSVNAEAVYGLGRHGPLHPVMRVSARVISVKRLVAGAPVSYGYTWRARVDTTVALVGIGYADGISRRASNRASAFLRGPRAIVGRIAMDVLSLDLGDDPVSIGDEAVVFGHIPGSTEAWAAELGVPPLSVTAGIGPRVPRVYLRGVS